jgi:D-allose transport system substrate-binding protein
MRGLPSGIRRLILCCVSLLIISGCHLQRARPAQTAVLLKTLANPYWSQMAAAVKAEAKLRGMTVDVYAAEDEDDLQGQQTMMEDLLSKGYKAIAVAPITPVNLIQPTSRATHDGIPVVDLDERMDELLMRAEGAETLATIATDNRALGGKAAQFILARAEGRPIDVAIIEGRAGSASSEARVGGALAVFRKSSNATVVATQPADWDREHALGVANAILARDPNLGAIYAANDTMALGAEKAVQSKGKAGTIIVVGTDGSPEALLSIQSGALSATVAQDPAAIGAAAVDLMAEALEGKLNAAASRSVTIDSHLITRALEPVHP